VAKEEKEKDSRKIIARNKKALHDYFVIEAFEAGIALKGTEVKSCRDAKVSLAESFVRVENGELLLHGAHIDVYKSSGYVTHDPTRPRKLLMHRREIARIASKLAEKGLTMVPLSMYFLRGKAKVEVALVRGKKLYDKRESLKKKEHEREMRRATRRDYE